MKRIFLILIPFILISFSCKGKEVKPSADFLLTQNAIDVTNTIKDAYENKDSTLIKEKVESSTAETILRSFGFNEANLSFTVRMVRITKTGVRINLNWTGQWLVNKKRLSNRGVATFVYEKNKMKLLRIEGDNPFLIPNP
jgi:hypothetical protein